MCRRLQTVYGAGERSDCRQTGRVVCLFLTLISLFQVVLFQMSLFFNEYHSSFSNEHHSSLSLSDMSKDLFVEHTDLLKAAGTKFQPFALDSITSNDVLLIIDCQNDFFPEGTVEDGGRFGVAVRFQLLWSCPRMERRSCLRWSLSSTRLPKRSAPSSPVATAIPSTTVPSPPTAARSLLTVCRGRRDLKWACWGSFTR